MMVFNFSNLFLSLHFTSLLRLRRSSCFWVYEVETILFSLRLWNKINWFLESWILIKFYLHFVLFVDWHWTEKTEKNWKSIQLSFLSAAPSTQLRFVFCFETKKTRLSHAYTFVITIDPLAYDLYDCNNVTNVKPKPESQSFQVSPRDGLTWLFSGSILPI